MMSDASDMLAAALEQMDGIIAGSKALEYSNGIFDCQSPTSPFMGGLRALHLVEDLRGLLEMMEADEREGLRCQVPDSTAEALIEWLQSQMTNGHISGNGDVYQERLARLENDKESLVLQVSVLTDQVEAQGEKIRDLEFCLEEHREKLNATEEMLQQELLSRTSLETQKLDLMAEISNLKLKLTSVEKDRLDYEDRFRDTEDLIQEINELRLRVGEMDNERLQYEKKLKTTKDELAALKEKLEQKEAEVKRLQEKLVCKLKGEGIEILDRDENCKKKLKDKNIEVQKMKKAVESLMAANEEKDRKIEELRQSLNRYKKVQDMVILAQGKKGKESDSEDFLNSGSVSTVLLDTPSLTDPEKSPSPTPVTASPIHDEFNMNIHEENSLQIHTSVLQISIPSFSSMSKSSEIVAEKVKTQPRSDPASDLSEGRSTGSSPGTQLCDSPVTSSLQKSSSLSSLKKETYEADRDPAQKPTEVKPPMEGNNFATLPPKSPSHGVTGDEDSFGTRKARSSFGRGFFKIKHNKRTASAPNLDRSRSASAPTLAETEKGSADHLDLAGLPPRPKETDSLQMTPPSPDSKKKARGIKKFFGKLKRSQSTTFNLDDMSETEFKRGGTRATAGPRLGWSRDLGQSHNELDMPFAKWTKEQVCNWLQDQGLGSYISNGRQWILSGQTLLQASQQDLEKELGIKHPLHRKKLQLALQALGSEEENSHGKLDYHWVTRWLDDIGLPQYKTQFDEGKVDGRVLHYMSVDDLLSLKVVSVLHHLSIKRAIQVLRINNFEPNCLRRRPSDESNVTPSEVTQWTNHRVMEWLRSVDLAEYAPNLRGSGVHGGLMVLEPRFNVETMAQLLNIPPNKTLLRRHLATHFNLLVGQDAQQKKREAMESPDYVLLTATAKVKPKKLAFSNFGSLRKKKQDDVEEYVCPMELGRASGSGSKKGFKPGLDIRVYDDDDLDRLEQMEDSEGTVRQIGAFSEGINNLTHMLKEDEMFKDFATRSPSTSITDEDSNV
ncbi:liprin-beta-1 isoform X6 [Cygnus olor]|uniref:liprin-beta-1 isoform X6 n=1 Tax=Cygnus olor TaxID=8869 RepID=UPI001ADEB140|nr:liprin-beta-1 isoform X6 [Cygnus olor]XP_040401032.1 liprin-beta-1 isoform X6 [Cygnus olor]XP_040401033.1 liprin-beta-1 isoform X6 [Cygnus olor]XP_040401034.1 liprin-beta-1 isoform X6 [Cygnus olor]XP_040401036.1 liprin-beta-1 isoform X6 [Cygnus olor]XP_040401037.1 liprin-beta-1 isoform X6 [Cygnus olor]